MNCSFPLEKAPLPGAGPCEAATAGTCGGHALEPPVGKRRQGGTAPDVAVYDVCVSRNMCIHISKYNGSHAPNIKHPKAICSFLGFQGWCLYNIRGMDYVYIYKHMQIHAHTRTTHGLCVCRYVPPGGDIYAYT